MSYSKDDWHDRLVDESLREVVGGQSPPDLAERILAARDTQGTSSSPTGDRTMASTPQNRSSHTRTWVLAASLLVNIGLGALLFGNFGEKENGPLVLIDGDSGSMLVDDSVSNVVPKAATDQQIAMMKSLIEERSAQLRELEATRDAKNELDTGVKKEIESLVKERKASEQGSDRFGVSESGQQPAEGGGQAANGKQQGEGTMLGVRPHVIAQDGETSSLSKQPAPPQSMPRSLQSAKMRGAVAGKNSESKSNSSFPSFTADLDLPNRQSSFGVQPADAVASHDRQTEDSELDYGVRGESLYYYPGLINSGYITPATDGWGFHGPQWRRWPGAPQGQWEGREDGLGAGPGAAGDRYSRIVENPFMPALGEQAISTFSIDVDTASYSNMRQMLVAGHLPPPDAVRMEELVNYFDYDGNYASAKKAEAKESEQSPFATDVEVTECPWQKKHHLVRIGVYGREIERDKRPKSNLVFLVDISGSMDNPEKLPLVIHGMQKLASSLGENDRVAIVVYASQEGLVLPSTPGTEQETILTALGNLQAGGSTAGGAGIELAYQIAEENFIKGGTNRVILCTDGDFNVGTTSTADLERLVEKKAKETKVFLSVVGFGRGNLNDQMMEGISNIGNGNYYYVDGQREAERVFVKGMTGMLVTIAKDVKIQVEFNPAKVAGYRLLGYENRMLKTQDFNDDAKDAGEIGSGHTVTALYEVVPAGEPVDVAETDEFRYQRPPGLTPEASTGELLTLKMRYKPPTEDKSIKSTWAIEDKVTPFAQASRDTRFAASVVSFGMLLRDSRYKGTSSFDNVAEITADSLGSDPEGERHEFTELVKTAARLHGEIEAAQKAAAEKEQPAKQPEQLKESP